MRLLLLRFDAEIRVARAPFLLASAACRGVPATRAGWPSAAKNNRRRVPFRVSSFVLVAQRRRRWRGPASRDTTVRDARAESRTLTRPAFLINS